MNDTLPRRQSDRPIQLVHLSAGSGAAVSVEVTEVDPGRADGAAGVEPAPLEGEASRGFLLERPGLPPLLILSPCVRELIGTPGPDSIEPLAVELLREWSVDEARTRGRVRAVDELIEFSLQLGQASSRQEVHELLARAALRIAGGSNTMLLRLSPFDRALRSVATGVPRDSEATCPLQQRLMEPGLVDDDELARSATPSDRALRQLLAGESAATVLHYPMTPELVLFVFDRRRDVRYPPETWDLLRILSLEAAAALMRIGLLEDLRELSLTDPLTGLANRRHLDLVLDRSILAARHGQPLVLAILDLDDFKGVNDRQGHAAGDRLLRRFAEGLRAELRSSDFVARYGGDEFVVILTSADRSGARALFARLARGLGGEPAFSVGIAEFSGAADNAEQLVERADRELARAKMAARDGRRLSLPNP